MLRRQNQWKKRVISIAVSFGIVLSSVNFKTGNSVYAAANGSTPAFENFITASGDKLYDGDREFRFVSYNTPNLGVVEDPVWHMIDPWEQEDAIKTIADTGGQVTRIYTLSVQGGKNNSKGDKKSHINFVDGRITFDEDMFKSLDKALELANEYGVRLIIPFVDEWDWWGGINEYAKFRGKTKADFWTDPQIRADFKSVINYTLNRTNTYTGVKYKDDKAVLCWETGNEIYDAPAAWTEEMAAYIKSIDNNHLLMDGVGGTNGTALNCPDIDIVTSHYYKNSTPNYVTAVDRDKDATRGKKPFILGEFGCAPFDELKATVEKAVANGTSGALIWSLRFHNKEGGFYFHGDQGAYQAYHWPGFAEMDAYYEMPVVDMIRTNAFAIQGLDVAPIPVPGTPVLFEPKDSANIIWRGSTGATAYDVERAESAEGPWTIVGRNISDCKDVTAAPLFADSTAEVGKQYYYRVIAKNNSGKSEASNVESAAGVEIQPSANLALNKEATASTSESEANNAAKAFDGDSKTRWASAQPYNDEEWISVDLGKVTAVSKVNLIWEAAYGKEYKIQVSTDNINWTEVYSTTEGNGGTDTITFDSTEARYVKMLGAKRGTQWGYSLYEFEVYANAEDGESGNEGAKTEYVIENADGYAGIDSELQDAWSMNPNGGNITVTLDRDNKNSGTYGMKYSYDFLTNTYAGITKTLTGADWSNFDTIQLWVKPDGSGNNMTLQFETAKSDYWETNIALQGSEGRLINVPLKSFNYPGWFTGDGKQELSNVTKFSIYAGKNSNTVNAGNIYFDSIKAVKTSIDITSLKNSAIISKLPLEVKGTSSAVSEFELSINDNTPVKITPSADGTWSYIVEELEDGDCSLLAAVKGLEGNTITSEKVDFKVVIDNSTPDTAVIENGEDYNGSDAELTNAWSINSGGGELALTLNSQIKYDKNYGIDFRYDFIRANYAGGSKAINGADWSKYDGIQLWLKPDGSKNRMVLQFSTTAGKYWEVNIQLNDSKEGLVFIPFTNFKHPDWDSTTGDELDVTSVKDFSIYVNQNEGGSTKGTITFDAIRLATRSDDGSTGNSSGGNGASGGTLPKTGGFSFMDVLLLGMLVLSSGVVLLRKNPKRV